MSKIIISVVFIVCLSAQNIFIKKPEINPYLINKIIPEVQKAGDKDSIFNSYQITISAVLFEANLEMMKERGINWQGMLSKSGFRIGSDYRSVPITNNSSFDLNIKSEGDIGDYSGYANLLFRYFENENLGEIISRLSVTVSNGQKGRMQVGSDVSVKQLDFAGNVTDVFVPTGTIIEVVPHIYNNDTLEFAKLNVHVERSTAYPHEVSTQIKKTSSDTEVIMFNNEEAIIGGLLVNEDLNIRRGVPVLKDLPWWVLGLRYLFGYDQSVTMKKEIVILLKTDIIKPLSSRLKTPADNLIREKINSDTKDIEKYKSVKKEKND